LYLIDSRVVVFNNLKSTKKKRKIVYYLCVYDVGKGKIRLSFVKAAASVGELCKCQQH